jgi:oligoribonuclease NrnB/cAMP/cGMP phosphodiesterase (DHH superfamily)
MSKTVALYHKDCNDGTTAAAVVLSKFPESKCFPVAYNYNLEQIQNIIKEIDSETAVYTVDCGIGAKEILNAGFKVTTIDHHIGAKEEFEFLAKENSNFTFIFDNTKSGASLTWSYFYPEKEIPELVKLVEDSDLFIHKYGQNSLCVHSYLSIFQNMPEKVIPLLSSDLSEVKNIGSFIVQYIKKKMDEQLEFLPINIRVGEHLVPVYNIATTYKNNVGNIFSKKLNKTIGVFNITGGSVKISFRGVAGQKPDALTLAKILGGGGHETASSATIPLKKFIQMIEE